VLPGGLYDTPDVDLQVSLLTDFVNHLYRVCVPIWWKFLPDTRYSWMTLEIQDAIRRRDRVRTGTVASQC
jgi:myo-inositol catabolism protein IolC